MEHQIGGAPVVDAAGKCVGVLSAADFMRLSAKTPVEMPSAMVESHGVSVDWQLSRIERLPTDEVRRFMTADPVTCRTTTTIRALCRMMIDAHVHRIIVVDEAEKPVGIVSSTDVIAAVAYSET
jgi:CBS domain-containing protein